MKIRFLLILTVFTAVNHLQSQTKPFRFGFRVAPVLSWISPDAEQYHYDGLTLGFSWGLMADITLADNYFIKSGFSYDYVNGKLSFPHQKDTSETGTLFRKYKYRYIEVPLTIKLRTNKFGKFAYFGEVGLGTAFKIRAKSNDEFKPGNEGETTRWESDISSETPFIKESLIAGIGTEYFLDQSTSLMLELTFSNSLSDILDGDNTLYPDIGQKGYLYGFQLNIGILF
jgi:hypothetical protein